MTREEAKKRLEVRMICANCPEDKMCYDSHLHSICEYTDYCDEVPIEEAVKVAIEALEQEPCDKCVYSTSEGCQYDDITEAIPPFDDCISRAYIEPIIEELENICVNGDEHILDLLADIKNAPPVTPQPKMGRWVKTPKAVMGEGYMWYCDNCEYEVYQDSSRPYPSEKYCPNCGAKMQEVKDNG